ncbi:MAG: hypothetical protein EB116_02220 [Betaproteobacteria bacterium]|nr:hypothetical protein [Betaproteobacteria bacterium]
MNATLAQGVEAHTQPSEALLSAAVLQMVSAPDLDHNLKRAEALIHEAAAGGATPLSQDQVRCSATWALGE